MTQTDNALPDIKWFLKLDQAIQAALAADPSGAIPDRFAKELAAEKLTGLPAHWTSNGPAPTIEILRPPYGGALATYTDLFNPWWNRLDDTTKRFFIDNRLGKIPAEYRGIVLPIGVLTNIGDDGATGPFQFLPAAQTLIALKARAAEASQL